MQRKKGFTLVELLVALVCGTLVLAMVSSTAIFLVRMNNGALKESQTLYQLQTVKTFVQTDFEKNWTTYQNKDTLNDLYLAKDGTVTKKTSTSEEKVETQTIVSDSLITKITFYVTSNSLAENSSTKTITIVTCTITYDNNQTFTFVAYAQKGQSTT